MSTTIEQVAELLDGLTARVARLPNATIQAFLPVLREAEKELAGDLARYLARVGAEEKFTAQAMRNALLQIRGALEVIDNMGPKLEKRLVRGGNHAGTVAVSDLAAELALFGEMFGSSIRPVALDQAAIIARGNKMLIPQFRNSAARYAGQVGLDIRRHLAIGVMRGETVEQLTKRLVKLGGPRGLVALKGKLGDAGAVAEQISEGLFARYEYWAARVVRTEVIQAYNHHADTGLRELAKDDPGMRSRWDAAQDYRVCIVCKNLHGVTIPVGGTFPGGYKFPPAHPNCRCALVAWHVEWPEMIEEPPSSLRHGVTFRVPRPPRR